MSDLERGGELIAPDDPRWAQSLDGLPHDVYHLPGYARFAARHQDVGEARAFVVTSLGRRLFVPLILRPVPQDLSSDHTLVDATSPRGYPGPLVRSTPESSEEAFLDDALHAFKEALRVQHVVSAFLRLHPLLGLPQASLERHGVLVNHGTSVTIDLSLSLEEMWHQTRHDHRRDINKATRLGLKVRIDEDWDRLDQFASAYRQSMERLGAMAFWRHTLQYFVELRDALSGHLHLCVVEDGDQLAAAALLSEVDGIVEYHLAGTSDAYVRASPSKLIIDFARQWAKGRGNRILHLAGSLSRGDSLNHFKIGFSRLEHAVCTWRVVTDDGAYAALSRRWTELAASTADPMSGYFPAYRKPPVG